MEEHLLTANLIIDKSFACNLPIWITSLDLSKAFDRVDWDALWDALRHHGVSEHKIWILQVMYHDQKGLIHDASKSSREFTIKEGVHEQTRLREVETWSKKCLKAHWKFASYVALLPKDRWVVRALHWVPAATSRRVGRPPSAWHSSIEGFCRWRRLGD